MVSSTNKTDHYDVANIVESGIKHHKPKNPNLKPICGMQDGHHSRHSVHI